MSNKFNKLLGLGLLFSALLLGGCSDGDGGSNNTATQLPADPDDISVDGGAAKGPLLGATVNVYLIDPANQDLKGRLIASGTTDANARIGGIEINSRRLDRAFLLEFVGGTDFTTGAAPLISPLRTIISAAALNNGQPVYATPLTTMILAYAYQTADLDGSGDVSIAEFLGDGLGDLGAVSDASNFIQSIFGFGVLDGAFDLFQTSPSFDGISPQDETLDYRMASEAFAALVLDLDKQGSASAAEIIEALAEDLVDGTIDGTASGESIAALADISAIQIQVTVSQNPGGLLVAGTSKALDELPAMMADEAAELAPGVEVESLEVPVLESVVPGEDSDGDRVIDSLDACPNDPAETVDADGDGFCDAQQDLFPDDPNDWADGDNDGVGDNADQCDAQSATDYTYGFDNQDGDALCALVAGDIYARDTGIDYDDNNPAVQSICDDNSGATLLEQGEASCFADDDNDTVPNPLDNCPNTANADQANLDDDPFGDVCDSDRDGDGEDNATDLFPDDGSGWLDCGDGEPATSCSSTYTLSTWITTNIFTVDTGPQDNSQENSQDPDAYPEPGSFSGMLTTSDDNEFAGFIELNPDGVSAMDYQAVWTFSVAANTLSVSDYVCADSPPETVFSSCGTGNAPNGELPGAEQAMTVTLSDDQTVLTVVYTVGDSVSNVHTFTFDLE